jgi:hypothetical protein
MSTKLEIKKKYDLKKEAIIKTDRLSPVEKDLEHFRNWRTYVHSYRKFIVQEQPSLN